MAELYTKETVRKMGPHELTGTFGRLASRGDADRPAADVCHNEIVRRLNAGAAYRFFIGMTYFLAGCGVLLWLLRILIGAGNG